MTAKKEDQMGALRPVDNLHLIRPLLLFRDPEDFYLLEILQRRKDGVPLDSSKPRVLRRYQVDSLEYLDKRWNEIRRMCDHFGARAMIRLNVRNHVHIAKHMLSLVVDRLTSQHHRLNDAWSRTVGRHHNSPTPTWVIDLDNGPDSPLSDERAMEILLGAINDARPHGVSKIVERIPSKTGLHLIVRPFDPREVRAIFPKVTVHKDNPTNLYIP